MKDLIKRRRFIVVCALVLLCLIAIVAFVLTRPGDDVYVRGRLPKGFNYAEVTSGKGLSAKQLYDAYDPKHDPAHPVLDVKASVQISNLGSRPGTPRPQRAAEGGMKLNPGAPARTSASLVATGLIGSSGLRPRVSLPGVPLPDFYLAGDKVNSPQFTGRPFILAWKYTGARKLTYEVSLSTDGGSTFSSVAKGLTTTAHTLTLPKKPVDHAVLRVSGMLDGRLYKSADTPEFAIVAAPRLIPTPLKNFVDPQVKYVDMPGLRISSETGSPVWFKAKNSAKSADRVVWQLSKTPFWGTEESFGSEPGIVASGTVDMSKGGEFSLDLKTLCASLSKPTGSWKPGARFLAPSGVYQLYLRVVPLDTSGKPIGDPGTGLGFTYGLPDVDPGPVAAEMVEEPKIQLQVYVPYYWEHRYERIPPGVLNRDLDDDSDFILFAGTDGPHSQGVVADVADAVSTLDSVVQEVVDAAEAKKSDEKGAGSLIISRAVKVEIQVATSPFADSSTLGLVPPAGLVYDWVDTAPEIGASDEYGSTYSSSLGHGIEYDRFVPSKETLEAMGGVTYYARGIFYVPDSANPSILHPYPSETLTIAFRAADAGANEVKKIVVKSDIPYVQFLRYQPIQWPNPNYEEYFEVARPIQAEEMTFSISRDGDFILPYKQHIAKYGWTREQYQAHLDKLLPPGAVIHYVKAQPGFWDEFFSLLKSIYSGVQGAYADAKESVVGLVDYIPLIGDDARGYLKSAARAAIDYGLASIGLPPSLPNVDQLASGGLDYVMKVAVDEALASAGVPPDSPAAAEITEKVRKEVADGMGTELTKAMLAQKQNPLNVEFLRLELKKLYAPAYVDVFVCNYSKTRTTRAGNLHFSSGSGFDVYRSAKVPVPTLKPGEHVTIRLYLDHLRNQNGGYGKYFDEKYNGTTGQPYQMRVYTSFELPNVNTAAKQQGLKAAPLPAVTEFVYDHDAYSYRYERDFVPADPIYESDSTPDTHDFLD